MTTNRFGRIDPQQKITFYVEKLNNNQKRLTLLILAGVTARKDRLRSMEQMLKAVNPSAVLSRGFALVRKGGHLVTAAKDFKTGDDIELKFTNDSATATIKQVNVGEFVSAKANDKVVKTKSVVGQGELFS